VGGTVNTTQLHDYMASLYRANGDILSAGDSSGWHVACAGFAVKRIIERFEKDGGIDPDDIFLLNDPYQAAIHQSDVYMISPIHYRECLVGWSATFVHVMDIGAMSPGGNSPGATEICHEGVRIPGIKLVERGRLRRDVFDAITNMTRQPVMVGLDLKCEIAANNVAKSRMQAMYAQYGLELVDGVSLEMIRYSESVLRKRLGEIPDGVWSDTGVIQADESWKVALRLTKRGDHLLFDFTGSDRQAKRGINLPYHATFGACYGALLSTLAYDIPKNHGAFGPIEVVAPEGTVVNVRYPGPVSLNTTSGGATVKYVANSVLMQMLATSEKWKKEVMALNVGGRAARHAGVNQQGRYYVSTLLELGGIGARCWRDGVDSAGNLRCNNVEWGEMNFPLLYLLRRHLRDGGGAGQFRGGVGTETALTVYGAPEGKIRGVTMGVAGLRNSGQGVFGGYPASPSLLVLLESTRLSDLLAQGKVPEDLDDLGGVARHLPYCEFDLKTNDVLYISHGGGGGYGDPLERDPQSVLDDVINGLLSKEMARDVYGVALDEQNRKLDSEATEKLRTKLRKGRLVAQE
jgi:N-methylhydantoinase B